MRNKQPNSQSITSHYLPRYLAHNTHPINGHERKILNTNIARNDLRQYLMKRHKRTNATYGMDFHAFEAARKSTYAKQRIVTRFQHGYPPRNVCTRKRHWTNAHYICDETESQDHYQCKRRNELHETFLNSTSEALDANVTLPQQIKDEIMECCKDFIETANRHQTYNNDINTRLESNSCHEDTSERIGRHDRTNTTDQPRRTAADTNGPNRLY